MIVSAAMAAEQAAHVAAHESIWQDPTFWVGLAFCLTVVVLAKPLGKFLGNALQARSDAIAAKLEEAKRLREEAHALLLEYQQKQQEAQKEADALLQKTKDNAEKMRSEACDAFEKELEKRESLAMARLENAKNQAMEEVRNLAIDIALKTTEKILTNELDGEQCKDRFFETYEPRYPDTFKWNYWDDQYIRALLWQ